MIVNRGKANSPLGWNYIDGFLGPYQAANQGAIIMRMGILTAFVVSAGCGLAATAGSGVGPF